MAKDGGSTTETNGQLLYRLDERTKSMQHQLVELKSLLEKQYVTKEELKPIRIVFYGMLGLVLLSVVVAMLKMVLLGNIK